MKLFYLINGLGPGGAERSLVELLPFYAAAGIDTTVVCLRSRAHNAEEAVAQSAKLRFLDASSFAGWIPEVRRLIQGERPDLLHTTIFQADVVGRVAAVATGIPVLTSLVNTAYDPVRLADPNVRRVPFLLTRELDGLTARRFTTHFHAITEAVKASAVECLRLKPDRITVVPRGRDPERLSVPDRERKRSARAMLGIPDGVPMLVNVARQEYQKGQEHLLAAMALVIRERPDAQLVVVGREGHATETLRTIITQAGVGSNVHFLGFRTDIPEILAAADVFVFPSLYEGLGGAVIEAMGMGLPVIASKIAALGEVVENGVTGVLVPPSSPQLLAREILAMIQDPERAGEMGRRGRLRFDEKFTIGGSAHQMIQLYNSLAGKRRAPN